MDELRVKMEQHMKELFWKIAEEKEGITMDGVPGYNARAQFVAGKVINLSCYVVLELLKGEESFEAGREALSQVIRMVSGMPMETWGILNGLTGLRRLQLAGMLEEVVDPQTMEVLKQSMDWRIFVDEKQDYALINKPTNYYGVAFGIARYRELLGWEPEGFGAILLEHLMDHIQSYSGSRCFMDETKGDGRFDRYSILIPSEVTSLLLAGGWEVPELIRRMLDQSAHIFLKLANDQGMGYSYGRSIGAYGETAALEVLSAAAELGVLSEEEKKLAYGYSLRVLKTMVEFWYDDELKSVNMWEKGRKTDDYRNKNRILGENLSLHMQMTGALEHWARAGYTELMEPEGWEDFLKEQAPHSLIRFTDGPYERALAIIRDKDQVWSLPLINGGRKYFDKDPYIPAVFQNLVLEAVPENSYGHMVPRLVLEDGRTLMPISFIEKIEEEERDGIYCISCTQSQLCLTGGECPEPAEGASVKTCFYFEPGRIRREDVFEVAASWKVKEAALAFFCFSEDPEVQDGAVSFGSGTICRMKGTGYDSCQAEAIGEEGVYDTPHGRLRTRAEWKKNGIPADGRICVGWELETRS